jgi:hypothetical protein
MGIGVSVLDLLTRLHAQDLLRPRASVIEIGAQQLANSFLEARSDIQRVGKLFGVEHPPDLPPPQSTHIAHGSSEHLSETAPLARNFWQWLGFDYAAIDIDGSPGSVPLDLNFDSVPHEFCGRFALVTNFGTTEHIANQLNAFKAIHDLTALGGIMVHELPAQGYFNHGFFNYNPKFFWMLARSNGYDWIEMDYDQGGVPYGLPENIMNGIRSPSARIKSYQVTDAGMQIVLRKVYDVPFVPPIDVQTGTKTNIKVLEARYWTVFDPQAFYRMQRLSPAQEDALRRRALRRMRRWLQRWI